MRFKRILGAFMAAVSMLSFCGCNNDGDVSSDNPGGASTDNSGSQGGSAAENTQPVNPRLSETGWEFSLAAMGGGGFVSGVFAASEQGLYYARTDVGGAYRYNTETQRWESMSYSISEEDNGFLGIAGLAFGEKDPNRVYLLAGTSYLSGGRTALLISDDYGRSFTRTELTDLIKVDGNGMGRGNGERLAVDPKNSDIVYAGGMLTGGLIKSVDGGVTFTELDLGTSTATGNGNGICSIVIDPTSGDENGCTRLFAAISRKKDYNIYKSEDGGASWTPIEDAPQGLLVQRMKYNGNGKIIVTYADAEGPWNSSLGAGGIRSINIADGSMEDISPEKLPFGDVVIDPANPDRMVACSENVYVMQPTGAYGDKFFITTDGGRSWKFINDNMTFSANGVEWLSTTSMHWCSSMAIDPNNTNRVMVVSGNGIYACDNIWEENPEFYFFAKGVEETVPYETVSIPGGELVTVVADYDGFTQPGAEQYGMVHSSVSGSMCGIAVAAGNTDVWVKCGGDDKKTGFWYSEDRGITWKQARKSPISGSKANRGSVAVSADGKTFYWAPENAAYIFWSEDKGDSWTQSEGGANSKRLIADPVNPEYVYASSGSNFYYSSDRGRTFIKNTDLSVFITTRPVVEPGVEGKIYFPAMGLQVSEDHGQTFKRIDTVSNCQMVALGKGKDENSPCTIFIYGAPTNEMPVGIYWSEDEGATWERVNDDKLQFGGTGNGKYICGDFNVYGRVYMSTLGLGLVYGDKVQ